MRNSPGRSHTPIRLSAPLDRQLNFYALAASAAGVSLLALAPPAEAKIVYTKVHQDININGIYGLDLNHDGTMDFVIRNFSSSFLSAFFLSAKEAYGNAVEGSNASAAALMKGAPIGPRQNFIVARTSYAGEKMAGVACSIEGGCGTASGPWANVSDGYMGLKFKIDGKTHYGWARLSVAVQNYTITATLTGYAYETIPNKGICAGQTSGKTDETAAQSGSAEPDRAPMTFAVPASASVKPASLAQLALGAQSASFRGRP